MSFRFDRRYSDDAAYYSADEFEDIIEEGDEEEDHDDDDDSSAAAAGEEGNDTFDESNYNNHGSGSPSSYPYEEYHGDEDENDHYDGVQHDHSYNNDNDDDVGREYSIPVISGTSGGGYSINSGEGNNPATTMTTMSILSSEDSRDYSGGGGGTTPSSSRFSRPTPTMSNTTASRTTTNSSSTDSLRERKRRIEAKYMNSNNNNNYQQTTAASNMKTPVARNSYNTVRQKFFEGGVGGYQNNSSMSHPVQQYNSTTNMMNGGGGGGGSHHRKTNSFDGRAGSLHSSTSSQDSPPKQPTRKRGPAAYQQQRNVDDYNQQQRAPNVPSSSPIPPSKTVSTATSASAATTKTTNNNNNNYPQYGYSDSFADLQNTSFNKSGRSGTMNYDSSASNSKLNYNNTNDGGGRIGGGDEDTEEESTTAYSTSNHQNDNKMTTTSTPNSSSVRRRSLSDHLQSPSSSSAGRSGGGTTSGTTKRRYAGRRGGASSTAGGAAGAASGNVAFGATEEQQLNSDLLSPGGSTFFSNRSNLDNSKTSLYNDSSNMLSSQLPFTDSERVTLRHTNVNNDLYDGVERERKEAFKTTRTEAFRSRADTEQSSKALAEEADVLSADDGGGNDSDESEVFEPFVVCGITCSAWCTRLIKNPLSLYQVSLCIVKSAPCFWLCCCDKDDLQGGSTSDRMVLGRLNVITSFFTFMQVVAALWLATVMFWVTGEGALDAFAPHLWNANGAVFAVGMIGAFIMIVCLCTVRIIRDVDLTGAIRYMWIILWLLPAEIFFTITLFDYHQVTEVWVVHWWTKRQLSWFRHTFCISGTADTLCAVPIDGGPDYDDEEAWCRANYDSTQCESIRNNAQDLTVFWMLVFYTALASWSVVLTFILLLVINSLERIISKPIVQKSRESNVPGWLTFPTIATAMVGLVYFISPSSVLRVLDEESWVAFLYLIAAALFLVALIMGWGLSVYPVRSDVDKKSKSSFVVVFIVVLAINAALLLTIFIASIIWSRTLDLNQRDRGNIACVLRGTDCTNCDAFAPALRCPEWTLEDVYRIAATQLKQSATLAAIFILYAVNVMIYGIVLRRHLANYQIDYV